MTIIVTAVAFLGALLGLLSTGFLVFDRVYRGRPIFALHARKGAPNDNFIYLRIKNVSDEDVLLDDFSVSPPLVGLSKDHGVGSIVKAVIGEMAPVILSSKESLTLPLLILGAATGLEEERIIISAHWDSTRRPWPWKRTLKILTTVQFVRLLKKAHTAEFNSLNEL